MRRFCTFIFLLSLALPVGISISGCTSNPDANYCNNTGHGVKKGTVYTISLTPVQGISLAYAQTGTVTTPTAQDCAGATASASSYTYQTDNPNIADISPTGSICAGTWNKFSAGGTPDYTVCTAPTASALASVTMPIHLWASAAGVSSNKIPVYIHPPISSLTLTNNATSACVSQSGTQTLSVQAFTASGSCQVPLCGTGAIAATSTCPAYAATQSCSNVIGSLSYSPVNSNVASIDQYGVITAKLPGSTAITATLSSVSSTAGYFTVCPPTSFTVALPSGGTSGTITNGVSQTLNSTAKDANGTTISGLTLNYTSTIPANVAVSSSGTVSSTYPGTANIYAFCQPSDCDPSPLDKIGQLDGTGLPIVSNQIQLTASGSSSTYLWIGAPNKSQYFVPVNLQAGSVGSPVRLPYMPNSMVLDQSGTNLYFGSYRELMTYSATTNSLSAEDINVPGVVLAVSPDNSQVLINDQTREVFYLYSVSGKTYTSFGGLGAKAAFTQDGKTLYIIGPKSGDYAHALFVYNTFTGWHTYNSSNSTDLSNAGSSGDLAITVPHVGAYFAGTTSTVARSYCWDYSNTKETGAGTAYPPGADSVAMATDHLAATPDGKHILGAVLSTSGAATLTDIGVTGLGGSGTTSSTAMIACPTTGGLKFTSSAVQTPISGISASSLNQVVSASNASIAFVTYATTSTTTGAALPYYKPTTPGTLGTLGTVTLAGSATAPVGGVFSPDNSTFFVGTSGDNLVHYINTSTLKDTTQINPKLVDSSGNAVTPSVIWSFPRAVN